MQAEEIVKEWFSRVSKGDGRGALELFDDDIEYTVQGSCTVSGVYRGKSSVLKDLFIPFGKQIDGTIVLEPKQIITQENVVAVRAAGRARSATGYEYNNSYCIIFEVRDGLITHLNEFLDTVMVETVAYGKTLS